MNQLLLVNKLQQWTSHDIVSKLKHKFKVKVGHAGTLDPNATGLLVCLLGTSTKLLPYLDVDTKTYHAECQLGYKTDTQDIWGDVISKRVLHPITSKQVKEVLTSFLGKSTQITPIVSAVKVKGKKLYEYHRNNQDIVLPKREIEVYDIELLECFEDRFSFRVTVSSGTYVRTLCQDIAERLHNDGCMSFLNRLKVGPFSLENAYTIQEILDNNFAFASPLDGLLHYPVLEVEDIHSIIVGKEIQSNYLGDRVLILHQNNPLAIYIYDCEKKVYRNERGLW